MLVDGYGRFVSDIRVSLTNRCNFKCVYCHNEGLGDTLGPRAPTADEMTADEVVRLLRLAREFDIVRVKFTGGEPTLRADLEEIVRRVSPFMEVSLTTNGSLLAPRAKALREAGLSRLNLSIDTLDPAHFQRVRRGTLAPVLAGLQAALDAGLAPLKVNMVLLDETVEALPSLVDFAAKRPGLTLQLIEVMPEIRTDMAPRRVNLERVRDWLTARADFVETRVMHHRKIYHLRETDVEIVDPVGNPEFCANCHRIRVTHDGKLKGCLNRNDDLVPTRGLDDDQVRQAFRTVVQNRMPYYDAYLKRRSPASIPVTARFPP
ncbi:MAG TPA: GTP 3',8-cyclase MoaA [Candidatus Thermoplasmatota archaeon]|nr:GTP 3',8-cyclase MoaA [Candidatus Thermoplasmatota archaeon]